MIEGRSVLGLVTARGGSRALAGKNLRHLGDKPLVVWVIEAALASVRIDRLILSSDDPNIISAAKDAGCEAPFVRPSNLATDQARSIDVAHHAISELAEAYEFIALLQPTSPLVAPQDIDGCIDRCQSTGAPSCVTVSIVEKHPAWMYRLSPDMELVALSGSDSRPSQRQAMEPVYALNGAVFVAQRDWLMESDDFIGPDTVGYEMPKERSIDIDTPLDLVVAEAILKSTVDGPV
jgi:CMP-N,N'-diacetyllegionaminic acid synthase